MGREIGYVRVHAHFSFINPLSHAFENVTKRIFAVTFRLASFSFWRNYIFIDLHRFGQVKLRFYFVNCFYLSHVLQFYFRLNPDGGLFTFSLQRFCRKSIYLFNGCVSQDYPREIVRVAGRENIAQYLNLLESVAQVGRTILKSRNPVRSLRTVKRVIAAWHMFNILWPVESSDIYHAQDFHFGGHLSRNLTCPTKI